jgi:beta-galactosidase/beta-glucuronidase
VHTDLLAAGLIPDPYLDENEEKVAWIGRSDWVYETTFEHDAEGDRIDLVCAGLDTVATVTLNDVELGRTANMHRGYRFTAGIWQDIGLHTWRPARLAEVRPQATVEDGVGRVDVHVTLDRDTDGPVTIAAAISGREAVLTVTVDEPELWWPRGYGDEPRYDLDVTLRHTDDPLAPGLSCGLAHDQAGVEHGGVDRLPGDSREEESGHLAPHALGGLMHGG